VSTSAEVDRLLSAADESTARDGVGPQTRAAVARAVTAARDLGDPGRLLHALGRATLNLALERFADGGDVTEVREHADEVLALAGGLIDDPRLGADAVYRTAQAGQILAAAGAADRGHEVIERLWQTVGPRPADDLDALRARTAALTALVTVRLETDPAGLGPLAAEMVDLQRRLTREDGKPSSVVDLSEALGIFVRVGRVLARPDLVRVALTEQYSLAQMFEGARAREQLDRITAALAELHEAAPEIPIVAPGPALWRIRGSYLDLLFEPGPSGAATGSFAARLAAGARSTDPMPDAWNLAWTSVVGSVGRLEGLAPGTAAHREALADTTTHMVDAARVAGAACLPEDEIMLLSEAIRRCAGETGPRLRHILGTALHNLAATLRQHAAAATALSEQARAVRRELADPADPRSLREYTNTLLLTAALAVDRQDWQVAVERLAAVHGLALALGSAGEPMAAFAGQLATVVATRAPEPVDRARAAGHWPYPTA
jgi:hypothetical protein